MAFQSLGNSRWVYNTLVALNRHLSRRGEETTSSVEGINLLPEWKSEHDWLKLGPSQPLQQTLLDYAQARKAHLQDPTNFKAPTFKKKFDDVASLRFPQPKQADWNVRKGWINLPKLGQVKYFKDPRLPHGTLKQVHLVREGDRWILCLCVDQSSPSSLKHTQPRKRHALPLDPKDLAASAVHGVDFGHVHAATDHTGHHYDFPMARIGALDAKIERIKSVVDHRSKAGKALHKHQGGEGRPRDSNRLMRARSALLHAQTERRDLLRDTRHQLSHRLTDLAPVLGVEDLRLKKLLANIERPSTPTASSEGAATTEPVSVADRFKSTSTKTVPTTNRKPMPRAQEKSLHRGWACLGAGIILNQLQYKAARKGGIVVKVSPAYTSQTCPNCQHIDQGNRESQAVFRCKACGFTDHADKVGALNVRTRAMEILMQEGFPQPKPPKHRRPRNPRKPKEKRATLAAR